MVDTLREIEEEQEQEEEQGTAGQEKYDHLRPYVEFLRKERALHVDPNRPVRYPWQQDVSYLEELSKDYGWPRFGHVAEIESLSWHLPLRDGLDSKGPEPQHYGEIVSETTKQLVDAVSFIPDHFMSRAHFEEVVEQLDWNSSPGYPYFYEAPNNRSFFKVVDGIPDQARLDYVWTLVQGRLVDRDSDPIRLFIKPEPHKKQKLLQKRYRLISSVSVVDQIIDQMIFGFQNQAFLDNHHYTPVRVGWSWFKGGWRSVARSGVMACDKTGWDWTVFAWLAEMELEVRKRLVFGKHKESWIDLATWRYFELFVKNEFITSGGLVFRVKTPGLMKSGCVNTIVSNSIMQILLHVRVSVELGQRIYPIWAMGDDTLQTVMPYVDEYLDRLKKYCLLKQAVANSEFAGFQWDGRNVEPLYTAKHAYQILHVEEKNKAVFSLSYNLLYWRSSFSAYIQRLMPVPDIGFDLIWDGE